MANNCEIGYSLGYAEDRVGIKVYFPQYHVARLVVRVNENVMYRDREIISSSTINKWVQRQQFDTVERGQVEVEGENDANPSDNDIDMETSSEVSFEVDATSDVEAEPVCEGSEDEYSDFEAESASEGSEEAEYDSESDGNASEGVKSHRCGMDNFKIQLRSTDPTPTKDEEIDHTTSDNGEDITSGSSDETETQSQLEVQSEDNRATRTSITEITGDDSISNDQTHGQDLVEATPIEVETYELTDFDKQQLSWIGYGH
ncbi:Hypothetical protein PHPALM_37154 [Phytophthora palmivora]|uniref:Uncharacterized protein n=1 Tax=Phytophthora palmivora TaxID=4796 RepID=A0A2P4WY48_9STRA|nr:Hypothetical protein PHPALM_37154 [Phytophthora palmivora]